MISYEKMPPLTIRMGDRVFQTPRERLNAVREAVERFIDDLVDRFIELMEKADEIMVEFDKRLQAMELELNQLLDDLKTRKCGIGAKGPANSPR